MRIVEPSFEIVAATPNATQIIERAGRCCYQSDHKIEPGSDAAFIAKILKREHESVIEHASMTVRFICDRGVSHELVRHRLAAYSQESTRYCDYGDDEISFIKPLGVDEHRVNLYSWEGAMADAEATYKLLRMRFVKPEIARSVLPNALKTEIVMTANFREWRHVFRLRTAKAAHPQMRQLMRPLLAECRKRWPGVFDDVGALED